MKRRLLRELKVGCNCSLKVVVELQRGSLGRRIEFSIQRLRLLTGVSGRLQEEYRTRHCERQPQ